MSEKDIEHVKQAQTGFANASGRITHCGSIRFIPRCKRKVRDKKRIKQGYIEGNSRLKRGSLSRRNGSYLNQAAHSENEKRLGSRPK